MIRYAVENVDEIKWFSDPPENWNAQKRFIPETIQKLRDAGVIDEFLMDHSTTTEDGDVIVDMEEVYEELRHESDAVLKRYVTHEENEEEEECNAA